jgi:uncharacterized protein
VRKHRLLIAVLLLAILVICFGALVFARNDTAPTSTPSPSASSAYRTTALKVGGQLIDLDIADSPVLQERGLGGRTSLDAGHGMVFPYSGPGQRCFWMKDMTFSIDIIWLDTAKKVGHIEKNLSPDTYPQSYCPDVDAQYVVELQAGASDKLGIVPGDTLALEL